MNKDEFVQRIKEHEGILYKVTRVYTNNDEDQKDLYQDIVYQLWKSSSSFRGKSKWSTWMYRVALNTAIAHLNKQKKRTTFDLSELDFLTKHEFYDDTLEEQMKILYAHIQKLNIVEKGLILLYLEDKSYDEIASITGFTKSNVGTRLARIKSKLKSQIKQ